MKKYLIFSFIAFFIVLACENEIPYALEEKTPKLILNAFINADSSQNALYLSLTGKNNIGIINNAIVGIKVNGELKEYARRSDLPNLQGQEYIISAQFMPGDVVRIDAHTDDGEYHAWIEETVPHPINILGVDTNTVYSKIWSSRYEQLRMKIRFQDRLKEKNYYRIIIEQQEIFRGEIILSENIDNNGKVERKDTIIFSSFVDYWPWEDIVLTDGRPATSEELDNDIFERVTNIYGVFDDSRFQDSEYTMIVRTPFRLTWYYWETNKFLPKTKDINVNITLQSITESEFYYLSALNIIDSDILDDYISDPIKVPSNVHGGTGFVGISVGNTYTIQAKKDEPVEYYNEY